MSLLAVRNTVETLTTLCRCIKVLGKCLNNITVTNDGSILIDLKSNLIVKSDGDQIFYTPGQAVIQSSALHLNPGVKIDNKGELNGRCKELSESQE